MLCFPWVKTLTFRNGDGGTGGVTSLLVGVVLEAHAWSACSGDQRHGKEGEGLVEDSSLQCPRWRKLVVRRRTLAR